MGGCASKMADSSPAKMKSEQQLGDVSSILQKLKDEVAYLQDEVEAKGAGFYVPLANQLNATRAAMEELTCTLDSCNGGLRSKDADKLDIVVKACQTEYIKLKLLNNNAKAYVNAK